MVFNFRASCLVAFLLLLCSCANQQERALELQALKKAEISEAQKNYPSTWKLSKFKTQVFDSEILIAEIQSRQKSKSNADQSKPKILLVHGLSPKGMMDWVKVTSRLSKEYDLLAVDLPGFGFSGNPEGKYSPSNYAKVLHELKQKYCPGSQWRVLGYSMGGAVSIRYADLYPEDVEKLVLLSVAGILERTTYLKHTIHSLMDDYKGNSKLESLVKVIKNPVGKLIEAINGFPDPTELLRYDKVWKKVFTGREEFNAGMALIGEDFSKAIYDIRHSATIIWGDQDKVAPLRTGQLLASKMHSADLKVIEGAGHTPMVSHTQQALAHILDGLKSGSKKNQKSPYVVERSRISSSEVLSVKDKDDFVIENIAYKEVKLIRCKNVTFKNVRLEKLILERSDVVLENVDIVSQEIALQLDQSSVLGTNVTLSGDHVIWSNKSRVDFVGAQMTSTSEGIVIVEKSQCLFSISEFTSPIYQGYLHGSYRLSKIVLDEHLVVNQ